MIPRIVTYLLFILPFLSIAYANTEVIGLNLPHSFRPAAYEIDLDNSQDPVNVTSIDGTTIYQISPTKGRKLKVDFLSISERKSIVVKNSRNLSPVSVLLEIVNIEVNKNYNFKVSWSALNPVDVVLSEIILPGGDNDVDEELDTDHHDHVYLKVLLKPDYYANSLVHIDKYLNDIILDVQCINGSLIGGLVRWLVSCLVVGLGLAKYLVGYIEEAV